MTKKEVLTVADKLYKLSPEAVAEALELSDESADTDQIDEKKVIEFFVTNQGRVVKEKHDSGYKKAESKLKSELEKKLKDSFGVESDLQGDELIAHIIEQQKSATGKDGKSKHSDEDVKKHPLYLALEKSKADELKAVNADWSNKLKSEQDSRNYEKLLGEVETDALKFFKELGEANLPEDSAVADKHVRRLLLDEIKSGYKYQKNGKEWLILDQDGNRVEDAAGNPKTFKDLVSDIGKSNFTFKVAEKRGSPGNGGDGGKGNGGDGKQQPKKFTGKAPATAKEYMDLLLDGNIDTEMKEDIKTTYGSQFNT